MITSAPIMRTGRRRGNFDRISAMGTNPSRRDFLLSSVLAAAREDVLSLCGIEFKRMEEKPGPRRYVRIHGDEETAGQALELHISKHAGTAYSVTGKDRFVRVADGKLDPNRMFSRAGASMSFRRENPWWAEEQLERALNWVDARRPKLESALMPAGGGLLFAVHNNSHGYSVEAEIPISQRTSLPRRESPHEFFLVTAPDDYLKLSTGPYNVVLQNDAKGEDDGSLSRLFARRGLRYVNLEVELGKLDLQLEMMEWLERTLPE